MPSETWQLFDGPTTGDEGSRNLRPCDRHRHPRARRSPRRRRAAEVQALLFPTGLFLPNNDFTAAVKAFPPQLAPPPLTRPCVKAPVMA